MSAAAHMARPAQRYAGGNALDAIDLVARTSAPRYVGGSALSPTSVAICNYLAKNRACSFDTLWAVFGEEPRNPTQVNQFRKRLDNLKAAGYIDCRGAGKSRRWWRLERDRVLGGPDLDPAQPAEPVAGPPVYNLLTALTYVPPPSTPVRAGADDFLKCASVGARC